MNMCLDQVRNETTGEKKGPQSKRTACLLRDGSIAIQSPVAHNEVEIIKPGSFNQPIMTRVRYMSEMGHVLCDGNDRGGQDHCVLHPLDIVGREERVPELVRDIMPILTVGVDRLPNPLRIDAYNRGGDVKAWFDAQAAQPAVA